MRVTLEATCHTRKKKSGFYSNYVKSEIKWDLGRGQMSHITTLEREGEKGGNLRG